jgi:hypothetical protein
MPENPFADDSPRGQAAVTNMSRPNRGTIGIRLEGSSEFGPTGEERYGSNVFGRVLTELGHILRTFVMGHHLPPGACGGRGTRAHRDHSPPPALVDLDEIAEIARQAEFAQHAPPPGPFQGGSVEALDRKPRPNKEGTEREGTKKRKGGRPRAKRPKQE